MSGLGLLIALAGFWGVKSYVAKHQREVVMPQQLMDHLQGVRLGRNDLDAGVLAVEPLRLVEHDLIRAQLNGDLERAGHPDPDAASGYLLTLATAYLEIEASLMRVLTGRLKSLPEDWRIVEKTADLWTIQAGDNCLALAYQPEVSQQSWRWVSIGDCLADTG